MANDPDNIVIGANGKVSVAPVGTALPDTIDEALNAAFVEVGFLSEDGITATHSKTVEGVPVWQSLFHVRRFVTEAGYKVAMVFREWNEVTVPLAFGGGSVIESPADSGSYRYDPPEAGSLDERAMVIDWNDGDRNFRLVIERGNASDDVESQVARAGAADLPFTFEALGGDAQTLPWYFLSDDANAFATA